MALTSMDDLSRFLRRRIGPGLKRSVRIVVVGQGVIRVQGSEVVQEDGPAEVTVTLTPEILQALDRRQLDPITAVVTNQIQVTNKIAALRMIPLVTRMLTRSPQG